MNNNNKCYVPIYSAVDTILIAATIVMAILKYNAGYDIPTIVVFTPLIVMAILFGIKLITAIITLVVIISCIHLTCLQVDVTIITCA